MRNCPHGRNTLVGGDPWHGQGPEDSTRLPDMALRYALCPDESTHGPFRGVSRAGCLCSTTLDWPAAGREHTPAPLATVGEKRSEQRRAKRR